MSSISAPPPIILASQSPRRLQLLQEAGYQFQVSVPDDHAECGICSRETPPEMVIRLARQKAQNVSLRFTAGIVLGCDTVAECQGRILGKPENREHAREMLCFLRGREHRVYSGVCLWRRPHDNYVTDVDVSVLRMQEFTDVELEEYLDSDLWIGKAGAFGYQDRTGWLEITRGSASNVVGLPLELLATMLAAFGCEANS